MAREAEPEIRRIDYTVVRGGALVCYNRKQGEVLRLMPQGFEGYDVSGRYVGEGLEVYMTNADARAFCLQFGIDIGEPETPNEDGDAVQHVHVEEESAPSEKREKGPNKCRWCGKPVKGRGNYCNRSHKLKWTRRAAAEKKAQKAATGRG